MIIKTMGTINDNKKSICPVILVAITPSRLGGEYGKGGSYMDHVKEKLPT